MAKILVTGSNGQLGSELKVLTEGRNDFIFTDIPELDICAEEQVEDFVEKNNITSIINCAAFTNVNKAEEEEEVAYKINATGPKTLAETAQKHNLTLIHISTDYVFDGIKTTPYHESDRCNPKSAYGRTKRAGEIAIQRTGCRSIIIRTAWLYSSFGNNFVKTMLQLGMEKDQIGVVNDQFGTPTYARDLAEAILHILPQLENRNIYGEVFHFTDEGSCSWYDFASKIMENKHIECVVNPITTEDYPTPAARPQYSVLDKTLIRNTFDVKTPLWEKSLLKMLKLVD